MNNNITPTAVACSAVDGNVLSNSPTDRALQVSALNNLGYAFNSSTFNSLEKIAVSGTSVNFATPLNGVTIVGIHFGNGSAIGNTTAFYKFNAGTNLDSFTLNLTSSSGAVLYSTQAVTSVPEPATWALMIGGFGLAGGMLRRRSTRRAVFG